MILTGSQIEALGAITPFDTAQIGHIEGSAYDLRIDRIFRVDEVEAHIGVGSRLTPPTQELVPSVGWWRLPRNWYYLAQTVETVTIPENMRGFISPRTTLFRSGVNLIVSSVAPGYSGKLTFALHTLLPLRIEKGARIASITIHTLSGPSDMPYEGVWQNGRLSTEGQEERPY